MRRLAALLPVAVVALLTIWLLRASQDVWDGDELDRSARDAAPQAPPARPAPAPEPALVGRPEAAPSAPRPFVPGPQVLLPPRPEHAVPRTRVAGRVRAVDGSVPAGGEVWSTSKGQGGGWSVRALHGATSVASDGGFVLPVPGDMEDVWIGARAPGFAVAFVDGATLAAGGECEIVLEEAYELVVRVVDARGEPLPDLVVRAEPDTARGPVPRYPGPDAPLAAQVEGTDALGLVTFTLERRVPVVVTVADVLTDPEVGRAHDLPATLLLRARPPARLVLDVFDGNSTRYLEEQIHVAVYAAGEEEVVALFDTDATPDVIEAEVALATGRYDVEVTANGREPVLLSDVVVGAEGAEVRLVVRMDPLAPQALLVLEAPGQEGTRQPPGHALAPIALIRRTDGGWASRGWQAHDPSAAGTPELSVPLRPGTYDVLLVLPQSGDVASASGVDMTGGDRRIPLPPRRGTTFPLYEVLPAELAVRGLWIEVAGWGRLPPLGHRGGALRGTEDLLRHLHPAGTAPRRRPEQGPVLGPYPSGQVVLVVEDVDGRVHRLVAP